MPSAYQFHPMMTADLSMVKQWLAAPHVVQWWGNPDEQFALVSSDLEVEGIDQFIVTVDGHPFAYIQCYDPSVWPDNGFGPQPPGTRGIDQFIGKSDMVGRGHGSAFVRQFVAGQLAAGAPRVITDPVPENARAIRAYEKADFRRQGLVDTPNGIALLMVCNA
ncbi:MAG: GNAT family N-acetyltransferase [Pseudolabrys sp.]